jgi:hypothetical protein
MKTICPIHEVDYSGKNPPRDIQNIRICSECVKKLKNQISKEISDEN